ncbi:MAG: hypothetical protein VXX80_11155, partial [Bacteroidota bacterium]|nr:hypothetical protein [Bacteroidota bacterium]
SCKISDNLELLAFMTSVESISPSLSSWQTISFDVLAMSELIAEIWYVTSDYVCDMSCKISDNLELLAFMTSVESISPRLSSWQTISFDVLAMLELRAEIWYVTSDYVCDMSCKISDNLELFAFMTSVESISPSLFLWQTISFDVLAMLEFTWQHSLHGKPLVLTFWQCWS